MLRHARFKAFDSLVDEAAAGQAAPNDLGVTWVNEDFMKAAKNNDSCPSR